MTDSDTNADSDTSLWEMLGMSPHDAAPPLEDNVWDTVLHTALDPNTPEADDSIVPIHDDHAAAADDAGDTSDPADHHPGGASDEGHHDVGGLLHDLGWDAHDLGPLDHDHGSLDDHDPSHPDLGADFGADHGTDDQHDLGGGFEHLGG